MPFRDVREFVARLEERGQLRRITPPARPGLEISEIVDRVVKGPPEGNVALLFENVEGFRIPVLMNAFGSAERMALALGVENLNDLGARVAGLLDPSVPGRWIAKLKKLGQLMEVAPPPPPPPRRPPAAQPCG